MDTKKDSALSEVPTFKVARVGKDRKKKGGALSFLRGGGSRGAWSGATGGAGAGAGSMVSVMGMSVSKVLLSMLVAALAGSAAIYAGTQSSAGDAPAASKKAIFSHDRDAVKLEGDTSNLPGTANTIPNSLGYLTGSRDGLTPEERAKKEAEAAAAAEAQRKADEEAAKKAEKDNTAGNPAVDPNALLASAKADGGSAKGGAGLGKKFGALTSSFGGGSALSGGAGLSGGVGRNFGGAGGNIPKGQAGKIAAMSGASRPSYSKAGNSKLASSSTKGFARKQLANTNALSRRGAAATTAQAGAADATTAFDNSPGAGNAISGPGVGGGGKPGSGAGDGSSNPTSGGGNGSPTNSAPTDCGANNYQDANGACQAIQTNQGKDAKPMLTMLCQIAMALLAAIAVISLIKAAMDGSFVAAGYGEALGMIIGVMGGIICMLGIAAMAMGDYAQGTVFTLVGGFIAAVAFVPGMSSILTSGTMVIASAAGMVLGQAAKMLDSGNHKDKAPVAAQQ